jgi:hypothetical protein
MIHRLVIGGMKREEALKVSLDDTLGTGSSFSYL